MLLILMIGNLLDCLVCGLVNLVNCGGVVGVGLVC